jgi:galactokinase
MNAHELICNIKNGDFDSKFEYLYGGSSDMISYQKDRYIKAIEEFTRIYPSRENIYIYSAPGRSEIGGNHTDHQHGCVLAAAVNLDVISITSFHEDKVIRLQSKGYSQNVIDLKDLEIKSQEYGSSNSLIRGICSKFISMGVEIGGFDAYTTSDVLSGSGLSSSAAFETLVGTIIDKHYNNSAAGAVEIAKIGQYAENVYFGKGSGLMDQMVSSVGGFVYIDFLSTENPEIERHNFNFEKSGYCLCITDTKGSHSDLTDDYVAVPDEMKSVAKQFGKEYLRLVDEDEFFSKLPDLHGICTDRALMRAVHFFDESKRAKYEADALDKGDIETFFKFVNESGNSSENLLQNLYSVKKPTEQGLSFAIMMSKRFLGNQGAVRVHGGGFAGTIQAFVPAKKAGEYSELMDRIFGSGSCYTLRIRPVGGVEVTGSLN